MAFDQQRLYKSINQARGIFDSYIYATSDTSADIIKLGYFKQARYLRDEPGQWIGGLLSAFTADGYRLFVILGETVRPITDEIFRGGYLNYADLATQTTPIFIAAGSGYHDVPNDGLGAGTDLSHGPKNFNEIWKISTQSFDFTELKLGDMLDIRLDLEVATTKNNQEIETQLMLGIGGTPLTRLWTYFSQKNIDTYPVLSYNGIFMADANIVSNPARFRIKTDEDLNYKVNGFYVKIIEKG